MSYNQTIDFRLEAIPGKSGHYRLSRINGKCVKDLSCDFVLKGLCLYHDFSFSYKKEKIVIFIYEA